MRFSPGLVAVLLLMTACPGQKPCKLHSDCSAAERCVNNACSVLCRTDRDCEGVGSCIAGECSIFGAGGGIASSGGGGAGGGTGGGGGGNTDAGNDAGQGAGVVDAGLDAGIDAGVDAGQLDAGIDAGPDDAGVPDAGAPDAGSGAGQYGDVCDRGGDCATGLCVGNAQTGLRMCTIVCGSEAVCDQAHSCLPVQGPSGGTINICIPSDSGSACPNGLGSGCIAGLCLLHPSTTALSVCATPCETSRACPIGFSCSVVNVGSMMQKVCSPVATQCNVQGTSTQCISRWCSTKATAPTNGICTGGCTSSSDCPPNWACGLDNVGTNFFSKCQPVGNPCTVNGTGDNDCYSKSCATQTAQGNYCTAICMDLAGNREPTRCPPGWMCNNFGGPTDPLWACEQ